LLANNLCRSLGYFSKQGEARFAFREADHGRFMVLAEEGVGFPVTEACSAINYFGTLFDTAAIGQFAPSIILSIAFAPFLLATQVSVEVTANTFVFEDILIEPLMTDANLLLLFQSARDLFRAPVLAQQPFHNTPRFSGNPGNALLLAFHCQTMGLLRTIAASPLISFQFAADSRFVYANHCCNLCLRMSCFLQRIYLVSLLLGKLAVGSHRAPLTWSSEKHYPTPAYLSATFKVALAC